MVRDDTQAKAVLITKADGSQEPFDEEKFTESLKKSGASRQTIERVLTALYERLKPGMSTRELYRLANRLLKRHQRRAASRYSLKRAVFELGPTGYPFEELIAGIYRAQGYEAQTGVMLAGSCARHEVDLIATRSGERIGGEVKFHNAAGLKTDLKVALYVAARFADIAKGEGAYQNLTRLLVTNTKFTDEARAYGTCAGLTLISWSYPKHGNLQELIEEAELQPITSLTTLSKRDKQELMKRDAVLCRTLAADESLLDTLGLSEKKREAARREVRDLCPHATVS